MPDPNEWDVWAEVLTEKRQTPPDMPSVPHPQHLD